MKKCDSAQYFRDKGYENCILEKGHKGSHTCVFVEWWNDD